jgi:hypothetical protein
MRSLLLLHPSRLTGENYGVRVQHIETMQTLLDGHGWVVNALDPLHPAFAGAALSSDVVVVHMLPHREIESLIRIRRGRGLPTVFEISDNFLAIGPWLPPRHLMRSPLVRQNLLYYAATSDAVQVYSPGLAELAAHLNPNIIALDPYVEIQRPRAKPSRFVFGWGGTTSHERDLAPIAPAIVAFCSRHADAVFAFMGDAAMFARLFGALPREQARVQPFGSSGAYLKFVRSLHVGLAPLAASSFNDGRTDTKFATYAACGAVALLQDAPAHAAHRGRALLFGTPGQMLERLESLYAGTLTGDVASRAHAWVTRERSAEALRAQRVRAYERLAPPQPSGEAQRIEPVRRIEPMAEYALRIAAASLRIAAASRGDVADVLDDVLPIAEAHRTYIPAQLLAARALDAAGRPAEALDLLDRAETPPLYADSVAELQLHLVRKVRPAEGEQYLARIASPLARLRIRHREMTDPLAFYRAVLAQQPYDYFALSAAIRILGRDGDPDELHALYERATLVAPELVPAAERPAHLRRFLGE